jgi:hypothetical protein
VLREIEPGMAQITAALAMALFWPLHWQSPAENAIEKLNLNLAGFHFIFLCRA